MQSQPHLFLFSRIGKVYTNEQMFHLGSSHLSFECSITYSYIGCTSLFRMENIDSLLAEQRKTNDILSQLVHDQAHKMRQETRRFWLNLIWHSIPLLVTAIFVWQLYVYVQAEIEGFHHKLSEVQTDIGTLNFGDKLKSFFTK